ncbi:hypothetical protein GCM10011514_03220 [Emticicia aquatilis]|uniref:Uncharacterized protein n=1 Tax=Emticicia aquatilis TaxID=1537369 RepID=A0A916YFA4_9BACT|nr:ABC-three component system middle component 6 [Emticicia aquatilis]GGD42608.1 hypothetical protein GCM10011514_03220 [Emticicia aquatilis]
MLIPSKYENLRNNLLVIGADVLEKLKKKPHNIDDLYNILKKNKSINAEQYYDVLTFLWLSDMLRFEDYQLSIIE